MSIAVVWSSANTDGLTASAKDAFIEGIRENGTDVEEIYLNGALPRLRQWLGRLPG